MPSRILGKIAVDRYDLGPDTDYLNAVTKLPEAYDEFGQGYWKNLSLYNASGHFEDTQYRNTNMSMPTAHAENCPELRRLLVENFKPEHLKMVRARSLVDGLVIPHRDFVEFDPAISYLRVFVPLENNLDSFHSDEAGVFQMLAGEVWILDAGIDHAAVNFAGNSRMFLCLDFMFHGAFDPTAIFADGARLTAPREQFHIARKPLDESARDRIIEATAQLLNRHTFKDLLFALSKYHFTYDIPVNSCYDWMICAAETIKDPQIVNKAKSLRKYLIEKRDMGERFTINDWVS